MNTQKDNQTGIWCVVANVALHQQFGDDQQTQLGTKHFSPHTKVYCFPPLWGDGYENIKVIGRHRGSPRLVILVMPSKRLTKWRVKFVCHPFVIAHLQPGWTKEGAERMVAALASSGQADPTESPTNK